MTTENINKRGETEKALQGVFDGYSLQADEEVWVNIQNALKSEKRRAVAWWQWAAAACLAGFILSYSISMLNDHETTQFTEGNKHIKENTVIPLPDEEIEKEQTLADKPQQEASKSRHEIMAEITENAVTGKASHSASYQYTETTTYYKKTQKEVKKKLAKTGLPYFEKMKTLPGAVTAYREEYQMKMRDIGNIQIPSDMLPSNNNDEAGKWGLAANFLSSGGASSSSSGTKSESGSFATSGNQWSTISNYDMAESGDAFETTHHPPIITGITVNFGISKRWSIESGISYTLLPSSSKSPPDGTEQNLYKTQLHYLGIPIMTNFRFLNRKKFSMYSSQGIAIDKGIAYRQTKTITNGGSAVETIKTYDSLRGFQGGVVIGIGADYKLGKLISIYFQPGIYSWFLNVNQPANVRNSHLLWPSLQMGARVNL